MESRRGNKYGIQQFNCANYDVWKFRVEAVIKSEGLENVFENPNVANRIKKYNEVNRKCLALIMRFSSNLHLTYTQNVNMVWQGLVPETQ